MSYVSNEVMFPMRWLGFQSSLSQYDEVFDQWGGRSFAAIRYVSAISRYVPDKVRVSN